MTDIRALYNADIMAADLGLVDGLLATDDGLETAVVLSLFTDRRANPDDALPDDGGTRRGWWGDMTPPVEGDRIGSRLWQLAREKQMSEVLVRAREYAEEALAWLVEDDIAQSVQVETSIVRTGVLGLAVTISRPQGDAVNFKFDHAWVAQGERSTA